MWCLLQVGWPLWSHFSGRDGFGEDTAVCVCVVDSTKTGAVWWPACTEERVGGLPWKSGEKLGCGIQQMAWQREDQRLHC